MRLVATGLLGLAALVFFTLHVLTDMTGVWGFLGAAAEAAMIGAMADWFAVTALFRHPLGIPIPHTAIIPRKKDALGASLSGFVAANFLKAHTVAPKILRAGITRRGGLWLAREKNQDALVARAGQGLEYVLARVDSDTVEGLARNVLVPKLVDTRKSPVLGRLLHEIVDEGAHHRLVDLILGEAYTWLAQNPQVIEDLVRSKKPDWMPSFLGAPVAGRLQREVLTWVAEVHNRRDHPARVALDTWLVELSADLRDESTDIHARAEQVLDELLQQEGVVHAVLDLWASLERLLRSAVLDTEGEVHARIRSMLDELARRATEDTEFQAMLDAKVATVAGDLVESFGHEFAGVISDTIAGWDAEEASERIELYVGRDLQYIRINGTVVGALVGMVIHAITLVIPGG